MPTRRTASIVAMVLMALAAGCAADDLTDRHLTAGDAAAAAGDWIAAFDEYLLAAEAAPDHEAARVGLDTAADRLTAMVPGLPVAEEVQLLRWLEEQDRLSDVAAVLNASVVSIRSGWTEMGSSTGRPDEQPARPVYLDAFAIDRYEVTNLQYAAHLRQTDERAPIYWIDGAYPAGAATQPVVGVSWQQAASYCTSMGKRLPTEAEWERACRGEDGLDYPWGEQWEAANLNTTLMPLKDPDEAWTWLASPANAPAQLRSVGDPVGGASIDGVCNLAGNAAEWVADWYHRDAYSTLERVNPLGTEPQWNHSIRGGAWLFRHDDPDLLVKQGRCMFRNSSHSAADPRVGFRCATGPS